MPQGPDGATATEMFCGCPPPRPFRAHMGAFAVVMQDGRHNHDMATVGVGTEWSLREVKPPVAHRKSKLQGGQAEEISKTRFGKRSPGERETETLSRQLSLKCYLDLRSQSDLQEPTCFLKTVSRCQGKRLVSTHGAPGTMLRILILGALTEPRRRPGMPCPKELPRPN
ncbi:UNVERIFIED_CONTAM: hypothetical protein K2H54_019295 [Gekko kuhli]